MKFGTQNNIYSSQRHLDCLVRPFIFFFYVMSFFFVFSENLSAMDCSKEEEEGLYKKGLVYRDEKKWLEAIECFQPLAEKKDMKAQHNLALCFFNAGDESAAYHWFQAASEQGLVPSKNNLGKMNLFYLLLPNELISYIASFFTLKDISCFNTLSLRAHWAVRSAITRTNFLSSKSPFAIEFLSLFNKVQFEPKPKELRVVLSAKASKGSIEVHFRDSEHLRNIAEEIPLIEAKDRLYFVHDEGAENNKELVSTEGGLQEVYFINFVADTPLKVSGTIERSLRSPIQLPKGSDFNGLSIKGGFCTGDLRSWTEVHALATAIDTFDDQLFNIRTKDAYQLLEDRQKSRLRSPSMYPDLPDLCPDSCLITASNIQISQKDYISSKQPFIYISHSLENLAELQNKLPEFSASISYINPGCSQSGVYCNGPLILQKGFEVFSDENLTVGGRIELYDHNLKLASNGSIWLMGTTLILGGSITLQSKGSLKQLECYSGRTANIKPEGMPEEDWQKLLTFWYQSGRIH